MAGPLSSLMMTATAGLLPDGAADPGIGSSLDVSADLVTVLDDYSSLPVIQQFTDVMTAALGNLSANTLATLQTVAANVLPALSNAIPSDYAGDLNIVAPGGVFEQYDNANVFVGGFTGLISSMAENIMGQGDLTRFCQIYTTAEGYAAQANQYINSNLNVGIIATTFGTNNGGMDAVTTGDFNQVTEAFGAFGRDLQRLGYLIDMADLESLGSPAVLVGQVIRRGGLIPSINNLLLEAGLDVKNFQALVTSTGQARGLALSRISQVTDRDYINITDSANKLLYEGMTKITGDTLRQICTILGVTLPVGNATPLPLDSDPVIGPGSNPPRAAATSKTINTMADLLDPIKIFPNSYFTLTMPTPDGLRGIYATEQGAVNTNLAQYLSEPIDTVKSSNVSDLSPAGVFDTDEAFFIGDRLVDILPQIGVIAQAGIIRPVRRS